MIRTTMEKYIAEFVGTFALVFVSVGAIASDHITGGAVTMTGLALAPGLTIAAMVAATIGISGAHLNPAVTIGALSLRRIDAPRALGYIVSQCLASIVAAALLRVLLPVATVEAIRMGVTVPGADSTVAQAVLTEAILTFILTFVICCTVLDSRGTNQAPLYIGLVVAAGVLMGGPISGAAMNPARHLGPALLGGGMGNVWIYWAGPVPGALIAVQTWRLMLEKKA